jgi:hypothetical protein
MAKIWSYTGTLAPVADIQISSPFVNDQFEAQSYLQGQYPASDEAVGTTGSVQGSSNTYFFEVEDDSPISTYTITWNPNGGTWTDNSSTSSRTTTVNSGVTPTQPANISRFGFEFDR